MTGNRLTKEEKQAELRKYRDLVLATIDYYLDNKVMQVKTADFDSEEYYKHLKEQSQEHFRKGRLTKLKQWFRDLTEMQVESGDLGFNKYLQNKTGYEIDILKSYFQRVEKIISGGKITSDNQFYDITMLVDKLCQAEPTDAEKIELLNKLLIDYERRRAGQRKKPDA